MNRIDACFQQLLLKKEKALIVYLCAGDIDVDFTFEAVNTLIQQGVHMLELGIPFSDPLADGPTIQRASQRAIDGGIRVDDIFLLVQRIRKISQVPLLLMGYFHSLYTYGVKEFVKVSKEVGVDGLIIPDLPVEEGHRLKDVEGLATVFLLSPLSTQERIKKVVEISTGFIYCVSVTGVTGAREGSFHRLAGLMEKIRGETDLPLAAGFGISTPKQAQEISSFTDGIIVGSAFINIIEDHLRELGEKKYDEALRKMGDLTQQLKGALRNHR